MPSDPPGRYYVAQIRGGDVAGIGSLPSEGVSPMPRWNTYVAVASVEDATSRAARAGAEILVGPLDVSPAGKLAAFQDPTGASLCLWERVERHGAQRVSESSAWSMSMLHTSDPAAANAFYGEVFGWVEEPFDMGGAEATLWRLPGYVGGVPGQPVPPDVVAVMAPSAGNGDQPAPPSHWSIDFWIADADAAADKAPALGGAVLMAPTETLGFRTAVLADPYGAAFSVSQLLVAH